MLIFFKQAKLSLNRDNIESIEALAPRHTDSVFMLKVSTVSGSSFFVPTGIPHNKDSRTHEIREDIVRFTEMKINSGETVNFDELTNEG